MGEKLSVVVPVYNEERTISTLLSKLSAVTLNWQLQKEIVIVNDCSTDNSKGKIMDFIDEHPEVDIIYEEHQSNQGKGGALHTGIKKATGAYIIIQDADLEYDPAEFNDLLRPIMQGHADVVFGSRFMGANPHRVLFFWHSIGNKLLTFLSNAFTNLNLTDMETCYKLFKSPILKQLDLKEKRFGFEPEVTAKVARIKNIRIYEVGISYYGRTYQEGKKINWRDGFWAIYCILRYNLFS